MMKAHRRPRYYALDAERHLIEVRDVMEWARMSEMTSRRVDHTVIGDDITVSTVFLGLDHRFFDDGPPICFETMVFGGPLDQEMNRYSSWDDAEIGHKAMVRKVLTAMKKKAGVK